jgi:PAP2 superfamily
MHDPDGSLGPSWVRLPSMVAGAFALDVVPRSLWRSRRRRGGFLTHARAIVDEHWTRERITLVVIGLVSFYVTYVSYRNLKNYLPRFSGQVKDPLLHSIDRTIAFGHEPAILLHDLLGETVAAHVLAVVYLLFLPIAPLSLIVYLVWARNISWGYWYATANCLCWAFGTATYYAVPSLGPAFYYVWLYNDLDNTGVKALQEGLWNSRYDVKWESGLTDSIQSVAGFASLHCAIVLTLVLITHYTVRHTWVRVTMWTYFGLTLISTLYFGWHYIADDVAGCIIAVIAVWLGALATGQKFDGHGMAAHPTTSTSHVPVDRESDGAGGPE